MSIKFYSTLASPPSLAVHQCLRYLNVLFELDNLDYAAGYHMSEEFAKKNPQKEIPVIDDEGFLLSESNAILQYLADKYPKDETLYPKDLKERALVNHRLCFDLSTYYKYICEYALNPMFFDYKRTEFGLKKVHIALNIFNTYLERSGTKYAATNHLTIADLQLVTSTMSLEAIKFDFSDYPLIQKWYATYKKEYPGLWKIVEHDMKMLMACEMKPPDLSHMSHPLHPVRKR